MSRRDDGPYTWAGTRASRYRRLKVELLPFAMDLPGTPPRKLVLIYADGLCDIQQAFDMAVLEASGGSWRTIVANRIRKMRFECRRRLSMLKPEAMRYPGEHRADALRYGLELHRKVLGERPGVPARLQGGRGSGKTSGHRDFTASYALLGNAPTIGDTLMENAKRRAADFLARHTEAEIRAGLIALGWTPPPAPGAERRGPAWMCGHCGQCNSGWASQCGRCDGVR